MNKQPAPNGPFVRPGGSPGFPPAVPVLALPRRGPSIRTQRTGSEHNVVEKLEARRQIAHLLTVLRASEEWDQTSAQGLAAVAAEVAAGGAQVDAERERALAEREQALTERESRLAERERDLAEAEALLQHHQALLNAAKKTTLSGGGLLPGAQAALHALKAELDRREAQVCEALDALREREKFLETSEARLFEKVQEQQEKETELEQREEEVKARESAQGPGASAPAAAPKPFDEFNE